MTQPLSGISVLDFTTLLPGPLATLMLAEAGAAVTKIERPGGDDLRRYDPIWQGQGAAFALLNRGKSHLTLDLKSDADRARLQPLLQATDILVEQFRPGVMDKLGFGYAAVRALNPRIIYCSISGYGQTGPRAGEAGHDLNYIGAAGLLALQPGPADRPVVPPALVADIAGGTYPAMINILLALRQRDITGEGCHLDIAMSDGVFAFAWHALAAGWATGRFPGAGESLLTGASPRYQLYPTRDGRFVACGALEDPFWHRFAAVIGLADICANDKADPHGVKAAVATVISSRSAAEWQPLLAEADCCATIVQTLEEAVRDPHFMARGLFNHTVTGADGATIPALPVPIADRFRKAPPQT